VDKCRDCESFLPRLNRRGGLSGWGLCTWGSERQRPDPRHAILGELVRPTDGCGPQFKLRTSLTESWLSDRISRARLKLKREMGEGN